MALEVSKDEKLIEKIKKFAEGCKEIGGTFIEGKYGLTCKVANSEIFFDPKGDALFIGGSGEFEVEDFVVKDFMLYGKKIYFFSDKSTIALDNKGKLHVGIPL
ncbi:MAG: hypothetical protein B6U78_03055 [Candidatus Aenigmarchaeota archaeon ex4484_224]|nr:MAG: hypothetical protein B6U78_03055 [Candidatus Aenigmarchaeota archaeon ex4484_224]